jgi:CubicO group peptidase (beta-lactamase class C family)
MMLQTRLTSLSLLALLFPAAASAQHFPSTEDLTAIIEKRVEAERGMAMVLGVMEADGSTKVVYYGDAGEGARPLAAKSVFEIGSITKVFTGILLAEAVTRGEVALDDPVSKYLPDGVTVPNRNGREITLLDITTHRSSLTRMPTNMVATGDGTYPHYTIDMLYEFLSGHELRRDIGVEYEYSNIAVALLGHALERAAGKTYEQLLRERILDLLEMNTTSTKVEGPVREWMTVGHDDQGLVAAYRNWPNLPAMGAIRSNAEDLLRFVAANTGDPTSQIERSMRDAHEVRNSIDNNADIGLNWHVFKYGEKRIITHGGATQGFRAFVGFDPDLGVGTVVLANSPVAMRDIGLHLINPDIPLSDAPVADRVEVFVAEGILETYVGEYELRPSVVIDVTLEDGGLFVQLTGQNKLPVFPESDHKFFLRVVNAQLTFTKDDAGVVDGVVLHQNGRNATAPRRIAPGIPLAASDQDAVLPGRVARIISTALEEERSLRIVTPQGYELSISSEYPVLYVLDGEPGLPQAAGVAQSLASAGQGPGMIVVHTAAPSARQRNNFAQFLTRELQPWVAIEYRTAPLAVVAGNTDAVSTAPDSFATIAIDSDLSMKGSFRGDSGLASDATEAHIALRNGFQWLFTDWALPNITTLASQPGDEGWATIDAHYASLSERFGYQVVPHEDLADNAARAHAQQGRWDEATREMERNAVLHPGSARTWNHLGDLYRMLCQPEKSRVNYEKAYELASAMQYDNVSNYAMEFNRIKSEIESGRECTSPADEKVEVEVDASVLESYVGTYEFSSRFSVVVTFERGRLWIQPTGQGKSPIFAESATTFYSKVAPVQFTFAQDGVVMRQDGRELEGRKTP